MLQILHTFEYYRIGLNIVNGIELTRINMDQDQVKFLNLIVKWSGKEYEISDLTDDDTVICLKHEIFKQTSVKPERQKLLNLKYKGKAATDNVRLGQLELKPNFKIMMMGSTEADIEIISKKPEDFTVVIDDFDDGDDKEISVAQNIINLAKIQKRILDYNIKIINPPRENKRLLVLDIDYTLFDHRSTAESGTELMRPYLHEFLESAYEYYDIVIWSATGMMWIEEKMKLLGVNTNPNYKIMFYMDSSAMISIYQAEKGISHCKPLAVIWGKFPQYSSKNTIMFDDVRHNFLMNPKSGLKIRPFRQAHLNRSTDQELMKLSEYLKLIAKTCNNFDELDHRKWETYKP